MVGVSKKEQPRREIEQALEEIGQPVTSHDLTVNTSLSKRQVWHYTKQMLKEDRLEIAREEGNSYYYQCKGK